MRHSLIPFLILACAWQLGDTSAAQAGSRRIRGRIRRSCEPILVCSGPAPRCQPCPVPIPGPVADPLLCTDACQNLAITTLAASPITFVMCPKSQIAKIVSGNKVYYQMQCDRCRREPATGFSPARCTGADTAARTFTVNSIVAEKCNPSPTTCQDCTRCLCENQLGAMAFARCGCRTSVDYQGLQGPVAADQLPQLSDGVRFVAGRGPQRVRTQLENSGKSTVDLLIYEVEVPRLDSDSGEPSYDRFGLGFEIEPVDGDIPFLKEPAVKVDAHAVVVRIEETDFRVIIADRK